jgi:hypothetical protein
MTDTTYVDVVCVCGAKLIHGGDHDCEPQDDYGMVSNLSCNTCGRVVFIYTPRAGIET